MLEAKANMQFEQFCKRIIKLKSSSRGTNQKAQHFLVGMQCHINRFTAKSTTCTFTLDKAALKQISIKSAYWANAVFVYHVCI